MHHYDWMPSDDSFLLPDDFFEAILLDLAAEHIEIAVGYPLGRDARWDLTAKTVCSAAKRFIENGEPTPSGLRNVEIDGFRLWCFAGTPDRLSVAIRYGVRVPERCDGMTCFFVVYAERLWS